VVRRPGLKLVLLCRSSSEIACLVPPTTTTTTLQPAPAQLIMFGATGSSVTLSVRGCVAVFPDLARITFGEFTCESSAGCPSRSGLARITESAGGYLTAEAQFVPSLITCTFLYLTFHCEDPSGNTTARGSFEFVAGQQPACAPGS
jgi:hypothetical protein